MTNPFEHTGHIAIELSNLCQYAWIHKKCPLNLELDSPVLVKNPVILPARIVYQVCDELGTHGYDKWVAFHEYNEPLMDPRLFTFISYLRKACPDSKLGIITNGHYLTPTLAKELDALGVNRLLVTLYGNEREREIKKQRVEEMERQVSYYMKPLDYPWPDNLDNRLALYNQGKSGAGSCYAPLTQVTITRNAEVALCCYDWRRNNTFGNLYEQSLADILVSEEIQETYRRLSSGDRFLDICKRCGTHR